MPFRHQVGIGRPCIVVTMLLAIIAHPIARANAAPDEDRPNVVLIMTDDQGYGDFGFTGNPVIQTPNLDRLATNSAMMANFYVSPVCAPTRASLMTGRYNYRTRVVDTYVGRAMMEPDEVTVAEFLRDAGYATGIFGKWHLGDCYPMRAMDQGFERSLVHRGGGIGQPSDPTTGERKYTDAVLFSDGKQLQTHGYCTDVYFDAAIEWIDQARADDRAFFTYIATNAPHGPFHDVPAELYEMYRGMDLGNTAFPQDAGHALPDEADLDRRARIFAMITNIDQNVGKLLTHLDEIGELENTLIMFMVDNGPNGRRYVAGMRAQKGSVYEGGIRSPFLAHWPARLKPKSGSARISAHIDVMPTILDACGVDLPQSLALDGRSVLPLLEGRPVEWPDRTLFIQSHRGDAPVRYHHFAARSQAWKLVHASGFGREELPGPAQFELYDMLNDPLEMTDVAAEKPEIVDQLKQAYDDWFDDVGSTRSDNYAPPRIHLGSPHVSLTMLTRQDWRHDVGQPWGGDSIGHWLVTIESDGPYQIACRWRKAPAAPAEVQLAIGSRLWIQHVEAGQTSCVFNSVEPLVGDTQIQATVVEGESPRGVHQIDVMN